MSVVPFAPASNSDVDLASEPADSAQQEAGDLRQWVLALQKNLEEAAGECARLQSAIASQQQLEQLLRQGRAHLQDLRSQLQQITGDRDRLETELRDQKTAHRREVEQLQTQQGEQMDIVREQLRKTSGERDRLARDLAEREAAHQQYAEERADERSTFERLLAEATANQRDMVQELDEQRQEVHTLREAAMRAQSLAREIMRAHEAAPPETRK
jgi:DNA repair exonuclease SbcCD ATPase subunit